MAVKTLICGLSGTGKSRSMKGFATAGVPVAVVNPVNKPLPFKNKFETLDGETDARKIMAFMKKVAADGVKHIVVDDFQYLLAIPYMKRVKETGWDKYNDFAANYYSIIDVCDDLPKDVTVYFMTHTETLENGEETVKLIGKLLREKICIEGLFTIVLKTLVSDGKYYFVTQNNGRDNVKSPEDMFPSYAIDNDLKYVDDKIRNYYEIGEFLSDEEMAEIDEEAKKVDVIKDDGKKKRRGRSTETTESTEAAPAEEPTRSRRRTAENNVDDNGADTGSTNEAVEETPPRRRSRGEVQQANSEAVANAGLENGENPDGVPFEEVESPKIETPPRRTRGERAAAVETAMNAPETDENEPPFETADAAPARRRRRG